MLSRSRRVTGAAVIALTTVAMAVRCLRRIRVEGASMLPTLAPGDRVVALPAWRLAPGAIVVVPDPRQPRRLLVKRVTAVDRRCRTVSLEGDNRQASTDSRTFGPVARRAVRGRVVYRYAPARRAGRVERPGKGRVGHGPETERVDPLATLAERYHQRE